MLGRDSICFYLHLSHPSLRELKDFAATGAGGYAAFKQTRSALQFVETDGEQGYSVRFQAEMLVYTRARMEGSLECVRRNSGVL